MSSFNSIALLGAVLLASLSGSVSQARDINVPEWGNNSVTFTTLYGPNFKTYYQDRNGNTYYNVIQYGGTVWVEGFYNRDGQWIPAHNKTVTVVDTQSRYSNCLNIANQVRNNYNPYDRFHIQGFGSVVGPALDAVYVLTNNVTCKVAR